MSGTKTEIDMGPDQLVISSVSSYSLSTLVWAPRQTRREVESSAHWEPVRLNMWLRNNRAWSNTPWLRSRRSSGLRPEEAGAGLEDTEAEEEPEEETGLVWEVWEGLEGSGYSTLSSSRESWLD